MVRSRLEKKFQKRTDGSRYFQTWLAVFSDPKRRPKRKRLPLHTKDATAAVQLLAELQREIAFGDFDPWIDKIVDAGTPVSEAVDRYLKVNRTNWSESTAQVNKYILRAFVRSLKPDHPVDGIDAHHIADYLNRNLSEHTRRNYRDRLAIFFRWCSAEGFCSDSPVPQMNGTKISRRYDLPAYLTEKQFDSLIEIIRRDDGARHGQTGGTWLHDAVVVATYTGVRRAELCNLQWRHVDLDGQRIRVANTESFTTKSGRERRVPLKSHALEIITALANSRSSDKPREYVFKGATNGQINGGYLSKRFRHYRRKAGLSDEINFHSLRHTFASWAVQRGMNIYDLKEILGHADIKQTQVYASLSPDTIERAMEKAFGSA